MLCRLSHFGLLAFLGFCLVRADEPDVGKLPAASKDPVDFVRDVKPLLENRCAKCHATEKPKGKFSLRTREDSVKSGESGPNIVVGDSAKSKLIHYVGGIVEDTVMPPKGQGQPLSRDEVARLRAWIDQGAKWPGDVVLHRVEDKKHWAFVPPVKSALPAVPDPRWPRNAIDYFVSAKQQGAGLKPSPEAAKITLVRRLYLDLIGLPPTPAEVDAFVADSSPKAYENLMEKLLASPHYGERWGRHWLDAARYADSDGYEKDMSRQIYFYRDWVVKAFNRDLPYDRFIIEQLAGDLLPNATQDQITATGFLRNSMLNEEGGIDPEQFRMDAMFDRMDALGKGVLGLTIQCCQCHSHKYDPMTQEEYYRLFAYLNNDHESFPVVYTEPELKKIAELQRRMHLIEDGLKQQTPDWEKRLAEWETRMKGNQTEWTVLPVKQIGDHDQHYFYLKDGSVLAQGYAPTKFGDRFQVTTDLKDIRAFRLELLTDPNLQSGGPGRSFMGTCALTEFKIEVADVKSPDKKSKVKLVKATADYANPERPLERNFDDRSTKKRVTGPVEFAIDGKDETAWGIDQGPGRRNQDRKAVFNAAENVARPEGTVLTFQLVQNHGGWNSDEHMNNNLGRFRISVTSKADVVADPLSRHVREILAIPDEKRTPAQQAAVFSAWRAGVSEWKDANAWLEELWREWPQGDSTLALTQRQEPRETHMLKRGDFLKPGKQVTAGVPAFLHPLADPKAPGNRLTLAKWLTDRKSPTTARVFVNRMWQHYFGTGLVSTPEDFGMQSDKPSHPELLDWLAVEFMESGWSIKHIHALIVQSATYRQSSHVTPELLEKDPLNRLLARAPRLRVDGEIVRDIALSASGLLNPRVGGPSIFSPAPAFLFLPPASYGPFNWIQATGNDRYRRALYTFRRRSTPYPMLLTFDSPNGDFSCVRRNRSNTPLQALTTLNEEIFMDAARSLASRVLKEGGKTDDDRLTYAFRLCVSRSPSSDEKSELVSLLEKQQKRMTDGSLNPMEVATGKKDGTVREGVKADQLAAYTIVSRVLLNLDETITKE
jgi:hypothetical protein